jgi:NAD(P)-dependent dehydrogenase (short-subunit alcohol dehydrogenase family)
MRTVIVTGGSAGIGRQIAHRLASDGDEVVLVARNAERLAEVATEFRNEGLECRTAALDVRDAEAVNHLVTSLSRVDGVVNNAAGNFVSPAVDMSLGGFRAVVEISLYGTFNLSTAVARRLIAEERPGAICNIIATYAWTGAPGVSHSAAAKAGMLAFTKSTAREWGPHKIRVNAVAPGFVATANASAHILSGDGAAEHMRSLIPLDRFGREDEIAGAVGYLMSDSADYVTGSVLTIDGGRSLGIAMHASTSEAGA